MPWTQVGTGTSATITAGAGNQTVSMPGTTKRGDLVVVAVAGDISCANSVASAGYTAVENGTGANPGAYLAYKVLTAAETGVDIVRDATILKACVVQVWSGCDPVTPVDAAYGGEATGTSANPNATAITVGSTGALVFQIAWLDDDDTTVSSYPSTYTNGISANTGQSSTTVGATVAICSLTRDAGSEDAGQWTLNSSDAWQAGAIAFKVQAAQAPTQTKGDATITGYAPTLAYSYVCFPAAGALTATGQTPTPNIDEPQAPLTDEPAAGAGEFTGYAPTLQYGRLVYPTAGAVTATGQAPLAERVDSWFRRDDWGRRFEAGAYAITQSAGALTAEGQTPTPTVESTTSNTTLTPAAGAAEATGYAPTLGQSYVFAPAAGSLEATSSAPTPSVLSGEVIRPEATSAEATGHAPTVIRNHLFAPATAALTATGSAPTSTQQVSAAPGVAAVTITGYAPTVVTSRTLMPGVAELTATGRTPVVEFSSKVFRPAAAELTVESQPHEAVRTYSLTVTFPFTTTTQGFVGTPGPGGLMGWYSVGDGGVANGSLESTVTGRSRATTNTWRLATDWATLGVPADKVVTGISATSIRFFVAAYVGANPGEVYAVVLTPTGRPDIQLASGRTFNAASGAWETRSGTGAAGLEISSNGSLTITASALLNTRGSGSPTVRLLQDNLTFVVTYTDSKVLRPQATATTITGYAPAVTLASVSVVDSWFPRYTDSYNTWAERFGVGAGAVFAPDAASLEATGQAPTPNLGSPVFKPDAAQLTAAAEAPTILGNPITIAGADYLDSEPATLTVASVRVVTTGNRIIRLDSGTSLALTGHAPALLRNVVVTPAAGSLSVSSEVPPWKRDLTLIPGETVLWAFTFDDTVYVVRPLVIRPAAGSLSATGYAPAFPERPVITPETGQLVANPWPPPTLYINSVTVAPNAGAAEVTGYAPTLQYGVGFQPAAGALTATGTAPTLVGNKTWRASGTLAAEPATVTAAHVVRRRGSGALQAAPPLLVLGTGVRKLIVSSALQSGPASLSGDVRAVDAALASEAAVIYARGRVIEFAPLRRVKPQRVNRYTVVVAPNAARRTGRPNTRKPLR